MTTRNRRAPGGNSLDQHALLEEYLRREPLLRRVSRYVDGMLQDYKTATDGSKHVHSIRMRIKEYRSIREAIDQRGAAVGIVEPVKVLDWFKDIVGFRLVCLSRNGRDAAVAWLDGLTRSNPPAISTLKSREVRRESGYSSHHVVFTLDSGGWPAIFNPPKELWRVPIEVQVRTLLEEAWGEVEHSGRYKQQRRIPSRLADEFELIAQRLRTIDDSVQRLLDDINSAWHSSVYLPLFDIDATRLPLSEGLRRDLRQRLERAGRDRVAGRFAGASAIHGEILADVNILGELRRCSAEADFRAEEALDLLLWARTRIGSGATRESECAHLTEAQDLYARARNSPGGDRLVFIPWRLAEVENLNGNLDRAVDLATEAIDVFKRHAVPVWYHSPGLGRLLRLRGVYHTLLWRESFDPQEFEAARDDNNAAIAATNEVRLARTGRDGDPRSIDTEYLKALNNQAYLLHLASIRDKSYSKECLVWLERANEVACALGGQELLHFLDTKLAILTTRLGPRSPLRQYYEADDVRRRLVAALNAPPERLTLDESREVERNLEIFEGKFRARLVSASTHRSR